MSLYPPFLQNYLVLCRDTVLQVLGRLRSIVPSLANDTDIIFHPDS